MNSELRERLQTSLGSTYPLERELGGGGMSRVFVAHEAALDRRRRREGARARARARGSPPSASRARSGSPRASSIRTSSRALGRRGADGLPYFTMPFVAGESLRERLR